MLVIPSTGVPFCSRARQESVMVMPFLLIGYWKAKRKTRVGVSTRQWSHRAIDSMAMAPFWFLLHAVTIHNGMKVFIHNHMTEDCAVAFCYAKSNVWHAQARFFTHVTSHFPPTELLQQTR
jgi:hypothetical protein